MLVGQSKAGSTSVSKALTSHPSMEVQRVIGKNASIGDKELADELHIFDTHRRSKEQMLAAHWDSAPKVTESRAASTLQLHYTPNYMYYPDAPFNILDVYPNARSIKYLFMLRDPVKRAVSSWKFHRYVTMELRSFRGVLRDGKAQRRALETCYRKKLHKSNSTANYLEDLPPWEMRRILNTCFWGNPTTHDRTLPEELEITLMHAHIDKSIYVDQLRRWFSLVGRENCFVFTLEEWAVDQQAMFSKIMDFIGLNAVGPHGYPDLATLNKTLHQQFNKAEKDHISSPSSESIAELTEFFKPYNEALFELLGRRLW